MAPADIEELKSISNDLVSALDSLTDLAKTVDRKEEREILTEAISRLYEASTLIDEVAF